MNNKIKQMTYAGLLTALAVIIPIQFGFLKIFIPPAFSATLAAHVPMMIGMLISPFVAAVVGLGSTIGFAMSGMPLPVVARAATHIIVGYVGAKIIISNHSYLKAVVFTAPLHALLEMIIVIPFIGITVNEILVISIIGTIGHHLVDGIIAYIIIKAVAKSRNKEIYNVLGEFQA